ncbi:MAG: (d)CMP kinase [Ahrensia sp.]|nr:(d)CMP kinase [Ahrensia sp.]
MTAPLVIAIDGPAASGKGTLARRLAEHFDLPHLDTGLTYRAVAKALLDSGQPLDREALAVDAARRLDLVGLDRDQLSHHEIGEAASKVAVMSAVRRTLVDQQRLFAKNGRGAVLDGRDIGTVVCPDAMAKLFITAAPNERARRRWNEMQLKGEVIDFEAVLADIKRRDKRDMGRADSPLKPARDAHLLDTSQMDIEAAFRAAISLVEKAQSAAHPES